MASKPPDTYDEGNTAIHEIVRSSDWESLEDVEEELLSYLSDRDGVRFAINRQNNYGYTPLLELLSCQEPSARLLRLLIRQGCDINIADHLRISPIHKAAAKLFIIPRILDENFVCPEEKQIIERQTKGDEEILIQLLHSGADIDYSDIFGRNALFVSNDVKIISCLLAKGADINVTDKWGRTLLHTAIIMPNYKQLVEFYIPKLKIDIIQQSDVYGSTALHYAALYGRRDIEAVLIRHGVEPDTNDKNRQTYSDLLNTNNRYFKLKKQDEVHFNDVIQAEDLSNVVQQPDCAEELCLLLNDPNYGGARHGPESCNIKATIVRFAETLCTSIGEMDERFKCTLFRTGSSEEGTKVGDPNEFDFVYCLDKFAELCDIEEIAEQKGFAQLKACGEIRREFSAFFDTDRKCSAPEVRRVFGKLLRRTVVNEATWSSGHMYFDGDIRHFEEYDRPVFTLKVRWVGCSYKDEEISIDLVPAVRKYGWWPSTTDFTKIDMMTDDIRTEGCLLLLQNPYHQSDTAMRISCSAADICLMKSLPPHFRESYRLCKLLRHKDIMPLIDPDATHDDFPLFEADDCVTSYMLKNCLFHILRQCKTDGLMVDTDARGRTKAIVNISCRLLQFLNQCLVRRRLPVYFLPDREDIFRFQLMDVENSEGSQADMLNSFHCDRRRAFVKIMLYLLHGHP